MKTLALSVIGGVLIPFCCAVAAGLIINYTGDTNIASALFVPVTWPRILYTDLFLLRGGSSIFGDEEIDLWAFLVVGNLLLYGLLTYLALWARSRKRSYP